MFNLPTRGVLEEILLQEAEKLCLQNTKLGRLVYEQDAPSPFAQKVFGAVKPEHPTPYYVPDSLDDTTLIFESRFESGNLGKATQV